MTHQLPLAALKRAFRHAVCEIHHTDQGVQYATPKYTQSLLNKNVKISMAAVGKAWENGFAERWVRTLREEELSLTQYKNFADAYLHIDLFITDVYRRTSDGRRMQPCCRSSPRTCNATNCSTGSMGLRSLG